MRCPRCGYTLPADEPRTIPSSRLLHALIRAYATQQGLSAPTVKLMMKYRHGVWLPYPFDGDPPSWRGQFLNVYPGGAREEIVYLKSESEYTKGEESALVDGVIADCYESQVDIDDIMDGVQT